MRRTALHLVAGFSLCLGSTLAVAAPASDFESRVQAALDAGQIDLDRALLERFNYSFAPEKVDPRFLSAAPVPVKETTRLAAELRDARARLRSSTVQQLEALLPSTDTADLIYDTTHFRITYTLTGANAVPTDDADGTGIPDFVEDVGDYAEYAYQIEFEALHFRAPALDPRSGRVPISFENMNSYGVTQCSGGSCAIVLENDYNGFPPNDDPEGSRAGAVKVSIAHELKHTSQYQSSQLTEGGWDELDATWAEEAVFPEVNDYVYDVASTDAQILAPSDSLDTDGSGTAADVIFEIAMSERFGTDILVDLWERRAAHRGESMIQSYDAVLKAWGSSLKDHVANDYMVRNYLSGDHATGGGLPEYPDAVEFPTAKIEVTGIPYQFSGQLAHLAGQFFEINDYGAGAYPGLSIGSSSPDLSVLLVLWRSDGGTALQQVPFSGGQLTVSIETPWSELQKIGVVLVNGGTARKSARFSLEVH